MCKVCGISCAVSGVATWGFFALVLRLFGAAYPYANALWLTLLMSVAMMSCPMMNPHLHDKCTCGVKAKKKKK